MTSPGLIVGEIQHKRLASGQPKVEKNSN